MTEIDVDFRTASVLGNTDDVWRTATEVRGALHLTSRQAAGILGTLVRLGLVAKRYTPELRMNEYAITEAGGRTLERLRNA